MSENNVVSRYTTAARINHWITAVSLILLALSGMALFHPSLYFLTNLFGGGQMTRAVHPWIGVVLFFSFLGLFFRFFTLNLWNRDDTVWMKNLGKVINNEEEGLPELGKYNAGQKLVFWGQSILILLLFGSGLVLWDVYFEAYTSVDQKRLSAVVHALCAIGAILIWIVHVYAAIWVKGTLRAMTRGSVTRGWSWKHHRKWFRQEVGKPWVFRPTTLSGRSPRATRSSSLICRRSSPSARSGWTRLRPATSSKVS